MNIETFKLSCHESIALLSVTTTVGFIFFTLWSWSTGSSHPLIFGSCLGLTLISLTLALFAAIDLKKRAQRAQRANLSKSSFVANMSHEIRGPVGIMVSAAELMGEPDTTAADRIKYVEVLKRNSQSLLTIIDDVLDLSKVEAGELKVQKQNISLPTLIQEVAWTHERVAISKGLRFKTEWKGPIPEALETDPIRLRQILGNLLSNAIKFTSEGHVTLQICTMLPSKKGEQTRLCFEVRDSGIGLSVQESSWLFRPFTQIRPPQFEGTGLGLALSKRLTEAIGGELRLIESKPGWGSVFRLSLPTNLSDPRTMIEMVPLPPAPAEKSLTTPPRSERLKGFRILLVDDGADSRTLMKWILTQEGAEVETAVNGIEAIEKGRHQNPDVILMDIQMPLLDGLTATQRLRSLGFRNPIFALTAHAMKEDRERCLRAGVNEHIPKPVQKEFLIGKLFELKCPPVKAYG